MVRVLLKYVFRLSIIMLVTLILLELFLSIFKVFPNQFLTETPNTEFSWKFKTGEINGIDKESRVSFDDIGCRSNSNRKNKEHKIIALGGSTTACFALTQTDTWTAQLENKLGPNYWVGNFGRPGNSSNHHVQQIKHLLEKPELKDVETVLILLGGNDLAGSLISSEKYLGMTDLESRKAGFKHVPSSHLPFPNKLNLYKLLKKLKHDLALKVISNDLTDIAEEFKQARRNSEKITQLPNLDIELKHYENNLKRIISTAKEKHINLILMTQPVLWDDNLEDKYENLLHFSGSAGNAYFYSTSALKKAMNVFNNRLKKVCTEENVECLELILPKDAFYDDMHFNLLGAEIVSEQIQEYITQG